MAGRPISKYTDERFPNDSFETEKDLCDYVERNIRSFSGDILGSEYEGHDREYRLYRHCGPTAGYGQRADFLISTKDGPIVVEAKNPKQARHELNRAVSQLLAQGSAFKKMHGVLPRMVLLTSVMTEDVADVIADFDLPIEVVIISREYAGVIGV